MIVVKRASMTSWCSVGRPFSAIGESVGSFVRGVPSTEFEKKKSEFVKDHIQYSEYIVGQGKVCPPLS